MLSAAQSVVPFTTDVRLDVEVYDGIVRVVTSEQTTSADKGRLRSAIEGVGRQVHPAAKHWRCDIQSEKPRPYTSHVLDWDAVATKRPRTMLRVEDVCVFPLTVAELDALARAYRLLTAAVRDAELVATFALGGLPLLHWLTVPKGGSIAEADAALGDAGRFHLLPGLNWSGKEKEKRAFREWLAESVAKTSGHILVFDTGKDGNGVRQAEGLAADALSAASPRQGARVTILGILDGRYRFGRRSVIRGANGVDVPLRLSYEFVRHLPTEDCELLVGYQVDRRRTRLQLLEGLVLVRVARSPLLVDVAKWALKRLRVRDRLLKPLARWDRYSFVASTGGGTSARDLVVNDDRRRALKAQLRKDYREEREFVAAGMILQHAEEKELQALDHAVTWGLVSVASRDGIERGIRGRFGSARDRLLRAEWNRAAKEVQVIQAEPDDPTGAPW